MPSKSLSPCNYPRCGKLTDKQYCDDHSNYRVSKKSSLYNAKWRRRRADYLVRNPFCTDPFNKHKRKKVLANVVDHKTAHKGNMQLFWDESNWQSLCTSCHNRKTRLYDMGNWGV